MEIDRMNALLAELKAGEALARRPVAPVATAGGGTDFAALVRNAIGEVNETQVSAQAAAQQFQLGNPAVSLEETMVALQKSSLSFQFLVQVRNRVVSAYHDIMNMQV